MDLVGSGGSAQALPPDLGSGGRPQGLPPGLPHVTTRTISKQLELVNSGLQMIGVLEYYVPVKTTWQEFVSSIVKHSNIPIHQLHFCMQSGIHQKQVYAAAPSWQTFAIGAFAETSGGGGGGTVMVYLKARRNTRVSSFIHSANIQTVNNQLIGFGPRRFFPNNERVITCYPPKNPPSCLLLKVQHEFLNIVSFESKQFELTNLKTFQKMPLEIEYKSTLKSSEMTTVRVKLPENLKPGVYTFSLNGTIPGIELEKFGKVTFEDVWSATFRIFDHECKVACPLHNMVDEEERPVPLKLSKKQVLCFTCFQTCCFKCFEQTNFHTDQKKCAFCRHWG